MYLMCNVGMLVKEARIEKGLTIQQLADRIGISTITIQLIEQGRNNKIMFAELYELVFRLGIDQTELLRKFLMDRMNYLYN